MDAYYTIPRNNRELQQLERAVGQCEIIPYQEIIGNYSESEDLQGGDGIIPYQEIIGNYSKFTEKVKDGRIIPYQEIIGNYSFTD